MSSVADFTPSQNDNVAREIQGSFNVPCYIAPTCSEYGHGLFGSYSEVTAAPQEEMANREGMMYCATDWFGWSNGDIPNAVLGLADLSNFKVLADPGQQGELNFLYLHLAGPPYFSGGWQGPCSLP